MTPQKYVPILIVWRFFGLAPVLQTILQNSTFRRFILWAILLKVLFTVIFKTEFATICEQKPSSHYLTQWWLSNRQLIVAVLHKTGLNFPWINMPKIHVLWYPFVALCLRAGYTERLPKLRGVYPWFAFLMAAHSCCTVHNILPSSYTGLTQSR